MFFRYEQAWQLYEKFSQDLEKLSAENWNSFRAHMYALDDFASGWIDQLKVIIFSIFLILLFCTK